MNQRDFSPSTSSSLSFTCTLSSCPSHHLQRLQQSCQRIQAMLADPLQLILHRNKCCNLAQAYNLGVQEVHEHIHKSLTNCPTAPSASLNLAPSLTTLYLAMLEGEKFISSCMNGIHWHKKALTLALSTEAVDVHFRDLLWSLDVVSAALRRILGITDSENLTDFEMSPLNASSSIPDIHVLLTDAKSETSEREDLALVLEDLQAATASDFTNFIFNKLSNRPLGPGVSGGKLPSYLWVDRRQFKTIDHLGCGGYAAVYKVEWLGQEFAMKDFSCVGSAFGGSQDFEREAAIQASLQHPNVVQFICCTETPDGHNCGLVMELMEQDLGSLIAKRVKDGIGSFSLVIAVDIMLQIARGMEYLHRSRIMHRDLKSFNVLVRHQERGRVRAKISDFGMAKAKHISSAKYSSMHTGTTYWRAPEVFESKADEEMESKANAKYTKKADVYSFAMVCYEIFSAEIPFKDVPPPKLHRKLIDGLRPRLPPSCPQILSSYIAKCWHADASKRPSFAEISIVLEHLKCVLLTFADPLLSLTLPDPIVQKLVELMDADTNITAVEMSCEKIVEENEGAAEDHVNTDDHQERPVVDLQMIIKKGRLKARLRILEKISTCVLCKHGGDKNPDMSMKELDIPPKQLQEAAREVKGKQSNLVEAHYSAKQFGGGKMSEVAKEIGMSHMIQKFTLEELCVATKNFSRSLGTGGFGAVFWGAFPGGEEVAVKRLFNVDIDEGNKVVVPELMIVGHLRHRNLVPLRGWCLESGELLLVYDFMSNGSLEHHVYGQNVLEWGKRYNIVCGLAEALHYLHHQQGEVQVMHRDVKPSNVLLDADFNARLGDFGLAKLLEQHQEVERGGGRISSGVVGTMGYLDPEYVLMGELGIHSDVYSFGVVVLEVACGRRCIDPRRPNGQRSLMHWLWSLEKSEQLLDAADPHLQGTFDENQMETLLALGLLCSNPDLQYRPTMAQVLRHLSYPMRPRLPHVPSMYSRKKTHGKLVKVYGT